MKPKRTAYPLLFSAALATVAACVTVNVNFPEATVQKATDDYVRDLYKSKEKGRSNGTGAATPASAPSPEVKLPIQSNPLSSLEALLIANAYAGAELSFKIDPDKVADIRAGQIERMKVIDPAKEAGQIGEDQNGYLALDPAGQMKPLQKKALEKSLQPVIETENSERKKLYLRILKLNGYSEDRLKDLEKSFAHSFQNTAKSGIWIQDEKGKWTKKP